MSAEHGIEDIYPLSPMQQGMLFHLLYDRGAGLNVLQLSCALRGDLDVAAFGRALERVIERHAVLRTSFVWEDVEQPLQMVDREVSVPLEVQDWSGLAADERQRRLEEYLADDLARGFDLTEAPLMRVLLARETPDLHRLVWSSQLILMDGWSLPTVIGEVLYHYEAFRAGEEPRLTTPRRYRDYIAWLLQREAGEGERFWRRELAGFTVPTPLPGDRGPGRRPAMAQRRIFLPEEATAALQALARRERLTVNTLVQAAWALLLARSAGTADGDVVFGATVSGRPHDLPGVEAMIGLFINTLPVRVRLEPGRGLVDWLRDFQDRQAEVRQYEHMPLVDLQKWSEVPRGLPLFDSIVVFENYPVAEVVGGRRGTLAVDEIRVLDANSYPLTLEVQPGARLSLRLTYDGSRFAARAVEDLLDRLAALLRWIGEAAPELRVADLLGATADERRLVLDEWNRPGVSFDASLPLHRLFEAAADRAPGSTALVCDGLRRTYEELERRANRLARHLRRMGVEPEVRVGLCAERSPELVEGVLGILKAGGAYVPLDPDVPAERLSYLLADSGVRVLLTQERLLPRLSPGSALPLVMLLDGDRAAIDRESADRLPGGAVADNAAYVIYTSGSTGKPKGVVVSHAAVARLLSATQGWFGFGPEDVWTLFHSFAFDFSVWEIWGALAYGGRLVVVPYLVSRSPRDFLALLDAEGVTVLNQTPSAFRQLLQALPPPGAGEPLAALRVVVFGGEALEPRLLAPWFERFGEHAPRLVNMYGITETTVHVTYRPVTAADVSEAEGGSLVGLPIPDLQVYLLGPDFTPVPPWAPGEICVGGAGLARGYLGRPGLTAERFVPAPWGPAGGRLYRSGDLARWLPWGDLEYLGRIDQQVKIRGFRIEPGEIEAALVAHPGVRDAAVVAREVGGERRLVGYVVGNDGAVPSTAELRDFLSGRLPEYMVPAAFVALEALPLTANGKLDRRALPAPDAAAVQAAYEYVPPETPAERVLAQVWGEVLGLERVGVLDNFFALGGDSILSIRVLARAAELGIQLELPQIFQHQTLRDLARAVGGGIPEAEGAPRPFQLLADLPAADRERLRRLCGGEPEEVLEDAYPLTRLQAGMLFHGDLAPESAVYHDIFSSHLEAPFDEDLLRRALARAVELHPVLRTSFALEGLTEPLQLVHRAVSPDLEVTDLRQVEPEAQERLLALWMEEEKRRPLALDRAPLLRVRVQRRSESSFQLSLSFHHAILDGWSVATLVSGVLRVYLALCRGEEVAPEAAPPNAFAHFVALERRALASEESRAFWSGVLAGAEATPLPRWLPEAPARRLGPTPWPVPLAPEVGERLRRLARELGVPVKSVLLAAHCRVLGWLAGSTDVVTGFVINGRPEEEGGERALGLFLNTLPLRLPLPGGSWGELARAAFAAEAGLLAHRRFPLAELQRQAGAPLFEAVFNFVHFHVYQGLSQERDVQALGGEFFEETNFDFLAGFEQDPFAGHVRLRLQLEAGLFPGAQADQIARAYVQALKSLADPDARYDLWSPLSPAERHQLTVEWNDSASVYPRDAGLAELFGRQARRAPEAPAVRYGGDGLTYDELERGANRLAHHLRVRGVGRGTPVGIAVERSVRAVVAILAVIKAGGAYVPLDPADPAERLSFLLEDSGASVILAGADFPLWLPGLWVVSLETEAAMIAAQPATPPEVESGGDDLAYVMYTSGSTGAPKGVAVPQRAIARLVLNTDYVNLGPGRRVGQAATTSFDAATFEIWGALLTGGTVVGLPREVVLSPDAFAEAVRELAIDAMFLTTSLFNRIALEHPDAFAPLQDLLVGGEALDPGRIGDVLRAAAPPARLLNCYGPTESTTFAIWHRIREVPHGAAAIPIGRPLANTMGHVVDALGLPAPLGTPGELLLGGDGLAWGYHLRPDLTAGKFVPDPFSPLAGGRLYRTGDLVRRRPDGLLEYLGRIDHQVKLRGFRIELGEIEAVLGGHSGVRTAVVVMVEVEPGDRRLAAYFVPDPAAPPEAADLRSFLMERLPEYMVPAVFVPLERLPLTPTGKADRRALPPVDWSGGVAVSRYTAPRTALEEVLAGIWEGVLKQERVGIHDDFFDLGGHSLLATQVISRVRSVFGVDVPLRVLFEEPSLARMAAAVEELLRGGGAAADAVPPLEALPRPVEGIPLSFSQQRLWFLYQLDPGSAAYNMPTAVRLAGALDRVALERSLVEIARRHESLRTTFREVDGEPVQAVAATVDLALPLVDLEGLGERAGREALRLAAEDAGRPFDLVRGPLFRPLLLRVGAGDHVLSATMHHIVSDGWSLDVFVREVRVLYAAFGASGAGLPSPLPELPELPVQYADYAAWQRRWLSGEVLERELDFWRRELAGLPPALELPADRPRPPLQSFRGASFARELGTATSTGLRSLARALEATPFMLFLAAFQALLGRLTGTEDFAVGVPVSGRTRQEIEGLIGFFVNSLVVRADLAGDPAFRGLLARVRERVIAVQAHQALPFEKLVEVLQPERDLARSPLFQVMFSFNVVLPGEAASTEVAAEGPAVRPVAVERGASQFDLSLSFQEIGDGYLAGWEYASDLFDEATVSRFADFFGILLDGIATDPERRLSDLPLLTAAERRQVLLEWNDTGAPPASSMAPSTLVERWRERVRLTPEAPAVVSGEQRVSFADLAGWAGRLARRLLAMGVEPEDVVAVCLERSPASIAAMLGIFQAGGSYLPLDPSYPEARSAYLLADSGARVLITRRGLLDTLPADLPALLLVDSPDDGGPDEGFDPAWPPVSPSQLAYVIYTSGSTGQPKGVGVEHGPAAAHFLGMAREYGLGPGDRALWFTSPGFDASLDQVLPALFAGAAVVPRGEELWSPAEMLEVCRRLGLTVVDLAPVYWQQWVREQDPDSAGVEELRLVLVAGEAMPAEEIRRWWETPMARAGLINGYGPTEAVVTAAMFRIERGWEPRSGSAAVPLGRPLAHRSAYVLDPAGNPLPVGVPGELCLGGLLARGYLRRPELTAERFVPDPWGSGPGGRLYRTGDLVRWSREGLLDFLGRVDRQVKVRGVRIEPGEVEAALAAHPAVRQAVVEARGDGRGGRRLVAWVVADGGEVPADLLEGMRQRLPEAMVPSVIVPLEALPVTASGKVDRRALPEPDRALLRPDGGTAPRTVVEETLAAIWREVLGVDRVSVEDGFFDLGGHSLLATQVISRVRNAFGVELPLRRLFEAPTLARLAALIDESLREDRAAAPALALEAVREADGTMALPLSFGQQRLWFLYQLHPESPAYNMPQALRLQGELDHGALQRALGEITRRHEALRTVFQESPEEVGEPVQRVLPAAPFLLPVVDLGVDLDGWGTAAEAEALRLAGEEAARPFDLVRGPLLRAVLLRLSPADQIVAVTMHHIVSDGWSLDLFAQEVAALYGAFRTGLPSPLPELSLQYRDYTLWQRRRFAGDALEAELAFWRRELRGLPARLDLPADRPRPPAQGYRGLSFGTVIEEATVAGLRGLARDREATLFMVLLAAFQTLLGRLAGTEDLAVGVPVSGRNRQELEELIGFFVNSLVMRADLSGDPGFRAMVDRTRERVLTVQAHQELPFERLVEDLQPERNLAHSPLFQVMFGFESARREEEGGSTARVMTLERRAAQFDLRVTVQETSRELLVGWEYSLDLFDEPTVRRVAEHFRHLLAGATAEPEAPLSVLPLLDEAERAQLVREWNDTAVGRRPGLSLHGLFLESAARTPDAVAVSFEGASLSYGELRRRAGHAAWRLQALGCGPEVRAGIALDRSLELIVALLAVLETGAAYVPLDPDLPGERLAGMVADAAPAAVLSREGLRSRLPEMDVPVLLLDGREAAGEAEPGPGLVDDLQLAYVIFTSGSTGRPKASMLHHRGIVNRLLWVEENYGLSPADAVLQKTPIGFDVSVWELFATLATGARMVLARPEGHRDPAYLAELITGEGVSVLHFVPSMLRAYLDAAELPAAPSVRLVVASGEALPPDLVERSAGHFPAAELENLYGPTEASVDVTFWSCRPGGGGQVPIGRPLANSTIYLVDRLGYPVPLRVPGELWIGGIGVGRGYLGRPDLTAERFVPDPFATAPGGRVYRSGDLARHRPDGAIEFLGRIDQQVKIRGFRVEPGEVEAALAAHPAVRQATVAALPGDGGTPYLAAWVVTEGRVEPAALREHLRARLPEPMVPAVFVPMDELPLTPSGKVDRRALPRPEKAAAAAMAAGHAAPRTPLEEVLASLWTEVLDRERVGVHDDFFDLGGHSLLATRLASRLRNVFGVQVPLRRLFETPTIAELAAWLEGEMRAGGRPVPRLEPARRTSGEPVPLSFAQRRLWFLHRLDPATTAYNMPVVLRLSGRFLPALLAAALSEVVRRHEALRTVFQEAGEEPVQVVLPPAPFHLPLADLSGLPGATREEEMRRLVDRTASQPFDLTRDPVLRGLLLRLGGVDGDEHVIALTLHHIAGDAWSLRVLVQEMTALYHAAETGLPSRLPELPIQYADYASWQRQWLDGAVLGEQLDYWRRQLGGDPPPLELPMERPRPEVQTFRGAAEDLRLDAGLTAALHGLARRRGATPFMVLLAAFDALLCRYSGQTDIVVGSPIAGRNRQEVEGLIGFFLNTLALRTDAGGDPTFHELVARVRETTLGAYTHQDLPFEHLLEELKPERSLARTPLFQVMINWDNSGREEREVVRLPDLSLEVLDAGEPVAKFDLELYARELAGRLELKLVYNRDLFGRGQVLAMLGHLEALLAEVLDRPERRLSELRLERPDQVAASAHPSTPLSIPERFALVVAEHPGLPAVWTPEGAWTYRDLWARAAGVAHALLALGGPAGEPGERVALLFTPGAPMVAAVLGALMAGKTYVPLDPSYPRERLLAMRDDSGAAALLAGAELRQEARDLAGELPVLDFGALSAAPAGWELPAGPAVPAAAIAYLLYTSGSTGEPKGVFQSHGNVLHHVGTYAARLGIGPGDRLTLLPSYGFDAAVMDLFGGLLHGAEICPWDVKLRGAEGLAAWMAERQITVYHSTPTFFRHFVEGLAGTEAFLDLRWVVLGGEAVRRMDLELFRRLFAPGCRLVNGLGPTESTLALQAFYDQTARTDRSTLPVGLPVEGTEVLLWNGAGRQVGVWGTGEILIRSPYLAHGYWRRPELTAAAFGPDPEGTGLEDGGRVYRTGDLGRLLPGGAIEFVGRRDLQVKIRGIRIEPAEIEATLSRHPGVRENAVVALELSGQTRLVAYVVAREGEILSAAGLRAFLGERLPAPLVPAAFVFLPALPWTATGKLDRRALPAPAVQPEGHERVAPRDEVEKTIAAVWAELLNLPEEAIGIHDSFFDLGGHSLLVTRVLARVQAAFGVVPPLRDLFADPTVAGTAAAIARERERAAPSSGMKLSAVPRRERQFRREDLDRKGS